MALRGTASAHISAIRRDAASASTSVMDCSKSGVSMKSA